MIKSLTDTYKCVERTVHDLFNGDTSTKKVQRAVLGVGFASAVGSRAAALHYFPRIGEVLPSIGALLVVALSVIGALSIRDYGNAGEVAQMREEALLLDIAQVMKSHGTVKRILDSGVLTADELTVKVRVYMQSASSGVKTLNEDIERAIPERQISAPIVEDCVKQIIGNVGRMEKATKWIREIADWKSTPSV